MKIVISLKGGEHKNLRRVWRRRDATRGLDPIENRHLDIHDHQIRVQEFHHGNRFEPLARLSDYVETGAGGQNHFEPTSNERLVVDDQNSRWLRITHEVLPAKRENRSNYESAIRGWSRGELPSVQ